MQPYHYANKKAAAVASTWKRDAIGVEVAVVIDGKPAIVLLDMDEAQAFDIAWDMAYRRAVKAENASTNLRINPRGSCG